jgi:hypothetical protein
MEKGGPILSDEERGIIPEKHGEAKELPMGTEQPVSEIHSSWTGSAEVLRNGESLTSFPKLGDIEVLSFGENAPQEQKDAQEMLIRLETSQAAGKATVFEAETKQEVVSENFDSVQHARQMVERVNTLVDDPTVQSFLSGLHIDDKRAFQDVINRLRDNSKYGSLAKLIMGVTTDKNWSARALGSEVHDGASLRNEYMKFSNEMLVKIDQSFTPNEVLGFDEQDIDLDKAYKRAAEISGSGLAVFGNRPDANFYSFLVGRSLDRLRIEAEKKKVAEAPILDNKKLEETPEQVEKPQEWLDQEREQAFGDLSALFNKIRKESGPEGIRQWLADLWNPALAASGQELLSQEDLKSLDCFDVHAVASSEVAGRKIIRPVLVFKDHKELQNLASRLTGQPKSETLGFVVPKTLFEEGSLLGKTGLLITDPYERVLGHEIRHTIDPLLGSRKGYDRIVDEVFAFYHDNLIEPKDEQASMKKEDKSWLNFAKSIGHETYFQAYSGEAEEQLTMDDFVELSDLVIRAVKVISEQRGHLETQRTLAQVKTLMELFSLAGQELPAILQ